MLYLSTWKKSFALTGQGKYSSSKSIFVFFSASYLSTFWTFSQIGLDLPVSGLPGRRDTLGDAGILLRRRGSAGKTFENRMQHSLLNYMCELCRIWPHPRKSPASSSRSSRRDSGLEDLPGITFEMINVFSKPKSRLCSNFLDLWPSASQSTMQT